MEKTHFKILVRILDLGYFTILGTNRINFYYYFGFYSQVSRDYDKIAYNAPYYLIVKSTGNERDETGPYPGQQYWIYNGTDWVLSSTRRDSDGDYDCVAHAAVAKNILSVGAVYDLREGYSSPSNVSMSSFSSWGPTDDGRIKPDIVANGTALYSSISGHNASYGSMSGTSMSAPRATGS